jgi:NADH:ubiquinone oxidoreductase subunit 6 (subunit J)
MAATILASASGETAAATLFYVFAGVAAASAVGVVVSRNVVRMAVWLLFALVGVAGLYFLLQSEFLAAVQLVIYVGGTLILILFGVMLTSKSPFAHFEPGRGEVIVAVSLAAVLLGALVLAIRAGDFGSASPGESASRYRVDALGQALLGDYLVPFELASVLLLVVMIGAAYLAKARRREDEPPVARGAAAVSQLTTKARRWHRD